MKGAKSNNKYSKPTKSELNEFQRSFDAGASFKFQSLVKETPKAYLLDIDKIGKKWIAKCQCEIKGNLLFVRQYVVVKSGLQGGERTTLEDWDKLDPNDYDTHPNHDDSFKQQYESYVDDFAISGHCPTCHEKPCMCSDPY